MSNAHALRRPARVLAAAAPLLLLTACPNVFAPLDKPSGDPQLLSAARAAMDRGDFATAMQDYQKLSASNADINFSGTAYATLDSVGANFGAFATAFGSGSSVNVGKALTVIANAIANNGSAGVSTRTALLSAYQSASSITDNQSLQAFVQFTTSIAFASDLLAEISASQGHLAPGDLAADATGCGNASATCVAASSCAQGSSQLTNGTAGTPVKLQNATAAQVSGTPTLSLLQSALDAIDGAVKAMSASSSFLTSLTGFTGNTNFGDNAISTGQFGCYRYSLINLGLGTY